MTDDPDHLYCPYAPLDFLCRYIVTLLCETMYKRIFRSTADPGRYHQFSRVIGIRVKKIQPTNFRQMEMRTQAKQLAANPHTKPAVIQINISDLKQPWQHYKPPTWCSYERGDCSYVQQQ